MGGSGGRRWVEVQIGMWVKFTNARMVRVFGGDMIMGVIWGGIKWRGDKIPSPYGVVVASFAELEDRSGGSRSYGGRSDPDREEGS